MSLSEHYPVLAAQLRRCPEDTEREPEDDDGLTGEMCKTRKGAGVEYSDPDGRQIICGDRQGRGR